MKPDDTESDPFVDALRDDLPSEAEEARMRARLAALGVVSAGALATKSAFGLGLAGKGALTKTGLFAEAAARLGGLSLGAKMGIATVTGALVASGPIWIASRDGLPEKSSFGTLPAVSAMVRAQRSSRSRDTAALPREERGIARERGELQVPEAGLAAAPPVPLEANGDPVREERSRAVQAKSKPLSGGTARRTARELASGATSMKEAEPAAREAAQAEPAAQAADADAAVAEHGSSPRTRLNEETALMDAAFAALSRGDRATAEHFVREHARRFPRGALRSERERAQSLLARGPGRLPVGQRPNQEPTRLPAGQRPNQEPTRLPAGQRPNPEPER